MASLIQLRILTHLEDVIISKLTNNKALHAILYAITTGKLMTTKFAQDLLC